MKIATQTVAKMKLLEDRNFNHRGARGLSELLQPSTSWAMVRLDWVDARPRGKVR